MFNVILYQPEIPPNTGNVIRLAANSGCGLHLVKPLGFRLSDRALRRAGLDYHEIARLVQHRDWAACREFFAGRRMLAFSARASRVYAELAYRARDVLVFGPETRGLPPEVLEEFPPELRLRLPMAPGNRSLNLSNAIAVVVYEAWRQQGFAGA